MRSDTLLACLAIASWSLAAAAAEQRVLQRAEAARYALIVGSSGAGELSGVLRDRYAFEVVRAEATRGGIGEAMKRLYAEIEPYDELLVHLALPIVRSPDLHFVPADADRDEPWTLLSFREIADWLNQLPTGAALVVYPSCDTRSAYGDPLLEELAFSKRPGPIEILLVCDLEAVRTARLGPEESYFEWRGEALALEMAALLGQGPSVSSEAVTSVALADGLRGRIEGLEVRLITVPLSREPVFRFARIATGQEYVDRYARAAEARELTLVLQDYLAASRDDPALADSFATFAYEIAASPRAGAAGAQLAGKEALQLRSHAVDALVRVATPQSRDALGALSVDATDSALVRRAAVSALSSSTPREQDLAVLRRAMEDPDPTVRETAVRGLVRAKDLGAADLFAERLASEEALEVRIAMIQGLSMFARDEDRKVFVSLAESDHWGTRKEAVAALSRLEPEPETNRNLISVLAGDEVDSIRETAAYALGRTWLQEQRDEIVNALGDTLHGSEGRGAGRVATQAAAASTLGRIGGEEAEEALRGALRNAEGAERLRIASAEALGRLRSEASVPELRDAAYDPASAGLRRAAVAALGTIGTPEAAEVVFDKLRDEGADVRLEAERWIGQLEVEQTTLEEGFRSESADVRQFAVYGFAESDDPDSLEALIESLSDRDYDVRRAAIDGLARDADPGSIDRVIGALRDGDLLTRQGAAAVLGRVAADNDVRIIEALANASRDSNSDLRAAAIRALGVRQSERGHRYIHVASRDPIVEVRLAAAWALGEIQSDSAQERLVKMAKTDESDQVREAAGQALSRASFSLKKR